MLPRLLVAALALSVHTSILAQSQRKDLPLSPTPLMGWGSWNIYGKTVTEADVMKQTDALVRLGLDKLGYTFVNVDGSWEGERDADGLLHPNPAKFTDMKALGTYIHSKGLKYGVYTSPGPTTCGGFVASYMHEDQDAQMFAHWGADYLKYDLCSFRAIQKAGSNGIHSKEVELQIGAYEKMHQSLLKTGRPIYYALCQYGIDYVQEWAPKVGATMYRTTNDIKAEWTSMTSIGFSQAGLAKFQTPGHWLDPDALEVGNGTLTADENRLHFSLWSMVAAPLILGNDLTVMAPQMLEIVSNKEVIAVDQDAMGRAGDRVWAVGELELWSRPLKDGAVAVALFNRTNGINTMTFRLSDIGWKGSAMPRDLWQHTDLPVIKDSFTADVPRHGVVMLVLRR